MQTLSFVVHIPLVCFAIAFPLMILFVEWLYVRTGNETYRTLARRWTKVMVALFAVGAITGTILSFEMGLLWPNFTGTFGGVFGLGFAIEGFSFFLEAIFIGIYIYGWDRLSPRRHLLSGLPVVFAGFSGSLMVISVNAWMNHPSGFKLRNGTVGDVHPWSALFGNTYLWHELVHMYLAGYMVTGFIVAGVYAFGWLRGRRGAYERIALVVPLTIAALVAPAQVLVGDWAGREVANRQPIKLAAMEGLPHTQRGAGLHVLGWYTDDQLKYGIEIPKLLSLLAYHDPNATVQGLDTVPPDQRPPVNVVRIAFQTMVGIGTLLALLGVVYSVARVRRRPLPNSPWFFRAVVARRAAGAGRPDRRLDRDRGRAPAVGRLQVHAHVRGGDRGGGIPVGYATLALVYLGVGIGVVWILRRLARAPHARGRADRAPIRHPDHLHPCRPRDVHRAWRRRFRSRAVAAHGGRRRAWQADPRPRPPRHGAGLGGQPHLDRVRSHGLLDELPARSRRSPRPCASRCSSRRSGWCCAGPRTLRSARRDGEPRGSTRCSRLVDRHAVRAGRGHRRDRIAAGAGRERGGRPLLQLAQPDVRARGRAGRRPVRLPRRGVPLRRSRPGGAPDLEGTSASGASPAGWGQGRWP